MGEVWFYHLERRDLASVLADLLEKSLGKGWRVLVRGTDPARLDALDAALWVQKDDSFLPHGRDGPEAARQPVLLTTASEGNPNGAKALFLVDGAPPQSLEGFERVCVVFEGRNEAALTAARGQWKAVKAAGAVASYWAETEGGRWEKKA
jgi:DNA polymerase-3 subunit chi